MSIKQCDNCSFQKSHLLPTPAQLNQLRDIIRSNSSPSEISGNTFRAFIVEEPSEVARYDKEIQRLQNTLAVLRSDRAILESYADGCRSVFAPVRRLPAELLAAIFDMCTPPGADTVSDETTPPEELERLAKTYLLRPSQVCSRWHGVVMDTPTLWSTIVADTTCWKKPPLSSDTLLGLVASSLERGVDVPLTLDIAVWPRDSNEQPLLELISQHARRWKSIYLWIHPKSIRFLASARGNLFLLEHLELHSNTRKVPGPESGLGDEIFDIAPQLMHLKLIRWPLKPPPLPWGQLLDVSLTPRDLGQFSLGFDILTLISNARYTLEVDVPSTISPFVLQPVTSNISALVLEFITGPHQMPPQTIFPEILERLTLPCLSELRVVCKSAGSPSPWPQQHFLVFASRSSLHVSLTSLEIRAVIQEDELLQCLEHLPSLETLIICDCEAAEGLNHVLITGNLLRRLVWRPDDLSLQVAPRLSSLCLISFIQFRDDSLCELLTSRLLPGPWDKGPLHIKVFWLPGRDRELSTDFIERFPRSENLEERKLVLKVAPYS